jgi:hypothetical protein
MPRAAPPPPSRLEPLLVREGARFACTGGGLCCTDVHLLAPLSRAEIERVERFAPGTVVKDARAGLRVLGTTEEGSCALLREGLCTLHAAHGAMEKPAVCRKFPYGLLATPRGGRITTSHRCPCRSMGERPPIDVADATASLADASGRLRSHGRIGSHLPLAREPHGKTGARDVKMPFDLYAAEESRVVRRLSAGEPPDEVLGVAQRSRRADASAYGDLGRSLVCMKELGARFDLAAASFGHALLLLLGEDPGAPPPRPWASFFDAAEARPGPRRSAAEVLGDWLADELWGFSWLRRGSLALGLHDLALRARVATCLTDRLVAEGARPDRAAAEAVLCAEVAGYMAPWDAAMDRVVLRQDDVALGPWRDAERPG